jgi:TadE-like protein
VSARSRTPRGSVARDDGQATVEFALLLPVLVLAAVAIIQVGLVVRDFVSVVHAAREAARAASVDGDVARAAHRVLPGAQVHVGPHPDVGQPIEVEVEYRSVTDLPLVGALFPDPLLHHSTVMRVER